MGWNRTKARQLVAVCSCGVAAALAGCSTGKAAPSGSQGTTPAPATAPSAAKAETTPTASGTLDPLTGLSVSAAVAQRSAVAVAVSGSDPVGLGSADVVFAEMTSPARYLAVFQSNQTSTVGPVTQTQPMDGQALSVLHPFIGYDGGTSSFVSVLDATKIVDAGYLTHPSLYSAGSGGLTVSTSALAGIGRSDGPPPGLFAYRSPGASLAPGHETHPTSVRIDIPGQAAEQWSFDAKADRWTETSGGPRVSVTNLIIQIVSFKTVYLSHKYGQATQSARVFGSGSMTVFSGTAPGATTGGTAATGSWRKPGLATLTTYLDSAGTPMDFAPGPTWIVLAPPGTHASQAGR